MSKIDRNQPLARIPGPWTDLTAHVLQHILDPIGNLAVPRRRKIDFWARLPSEKMSQQLTSPERKTHVLPDPLLAMRQPIFLRRSRFF